MLKTYIGIDPGKSGGIVAIHPDGVILVAKTPLVADEISIPGLLEFLDHYKLQNPVVVIEDVHSIFGTSAKSNFQFGRALGLVEGLVAALQLPMVKVAPKTWQKIAFLGIPEQRKPSSKPGKLGPLDTKPMALLAAQRLYPKVNLLASERSKKPHEGIVDSLLLAHYGKVTNL